MSEIYINDKLISDLVRTSSLILDDDNIVTHKLLNGKTIVQHIGETSESIEVACILNETNKVILNDAFKSVLRVLIKKFDVYYAGYLSESPKSSMFSNSLDANKRLYQVEFILNIDGDI